VLNGFKQFILRGNVIDLAVAVVIGAAFTNVVNAIVNSVFNPALGALFNAASLEKALPVTIPTTTPGVTATMYFGAVIGAVIQFLLVALVVYFAIIVPINYLSKLSFKKKEAGIVEEKPAPPTELELLSDIRDLLAKRDAE
jgi:large conductance mechanosensitive channel